MRLAWRLWSRCNRRWIRTCGQHRSDQQLLLGVNVPCMAVSSLLDQILMAFIRQMTRELVADEHEAVMAHRSGCASTIYDTRITGTSRDSR